MPISAQSSNTNLSGLEVTQSSDGETFTALTFTPAVDKGTRSYYATVENTVTHVKIKATLEDTDATFQAFNSSEVGLNTPTYASGVNSRAIPVRVGITTIQIFITAEDGSTGIPYFVNVTRKTTATSVIQFASSTYSVTEGDANKDYSMTLSVNPAAEATIGVRLAQAAGDIVTDTAKRGTDWDFKSAGCITIPVGTSSFSCTITVKGDTKNEGDETFTLKVEVAGGPGEIGDQNSAKITIKDDDLPTPVNLSVSPTTVNEGSPVTVTATVDAVRKTDITIPIALTHGSSEPGDFGSLTSVSIAKGSLSGTGTISTSNDSDTRDETFNVAFGTLPSSVIAGSTTSATVTINDTTIPTVTLSVSPSTVNEGSLVTVRVSLSATLENNVTIPITVTRNSAETGDHGTLSQITIASNSLSNTGTISTTVDSDTEEETFTVALDTNNLPAGVTAGSPANAQVTIVDGTKPTVSLSVSPDVVSEGDSVTVRVSISASLQADVAIPVNVVQRTSEAGDHDTQLSDITILAGETSGIGTIATHQDEETEDETFTVELDTNNLPAVVTVGSPTSVQVTIADGTTPRVNLSASPNPVTEGDPVTVTVTLSVPLQEDVEIPVSVVQTSSEAGDHDTQLSDITILAGATSGTGTINTYQDDDADDETFTVALATLPEQVRVGSPSSLEINISDNDDPPDEPTDPIDDSGDDDPTDEPIDPIDDSGDDDPPDEPTDPIDDSGDDDPDSANGDDDADDPSEQQSTNRAPTTVERIADMALRGGAVLSIDPSAYFNDPDGDDLTYVAKSSHESVATAGIDDNTLTVRGIGRGTTNITLTATDADGETAAQTFVVTVIGTEVVWYLPSASDSARQGFLRVQNHSDMDGEISISAIDDAGRRYEPLTLALNARTVVSVSADDLENGNADKGLTGSTGGGAGAWRLQLDSDTLDFEALAYIRALDGFVSGMNATAPRAEDGGLEVALFNPASSVDPQSLLRLVNPGTTDAEATLTGVDDAGNSPGEPVRVMLTAGSSCTLDASELESGAGLACGAPQAGLGDGVGRWRLTVESNASLVAMSLLANADGLLTNLSDKALPSTEGAWRADLFPAATDPRGVQGLLRVVNRSADDGIVTIFPSDDADTQYDALRLNLRAGTTVHIDADDLELGNQSKGLTGSTGSGTGTWRLRFTSELRFEVHAYASASNGFLTAMQAEAPGVDSVRRIAYLNPGRSGGESGVLRLVNWTATDQTVMVDGTDDLGLRPGSTVRVIVPATDAVELTAAELATGIADAIASGALGEGTGSWRLRVDGAVTAMSLLASSRGHLTNLSYAHPSRLIGPLRLALLPAPATVTLRSPGARQLLGRWSKVEGARYEVVRLRNGIVEKSFTLRQTSSTAIHWHSALQGRTYTIRARSVNAEGVRGPWRESNEVVAD